MPAIWFLVRNWAILYTRRLVVPGGPLVQHCYESTLCMTRRVLPTACRLYEFVVFPIQRCRAVHEHLAIATCYWRG